MFENGNSSREDVLNSVQESSSRPETAESQSKRQKTMQYTPAPMLPEVGSITGGHWVSEDAFHAIGR